MDFLRKHRERALLLAPVFIILIVFNGYLNPWQERVFGDTAPYVIDTAKAGYEFFGTNFLTGFSPSFQAPYSYELERVKYALAAHGTDARVIQWLVIFLPFLISCFLSYLLFWRLSRGTLVGLAVWLFYTFSTFFLFVSSIHTNILTAMNFSLFFLYLWQRYLDSLQTLAETFRYVALGTAALVIACAFDMRMVIVTAPFFAALFIYLWLTSRTRDSLLRLGLVNGIIALLVILNFGYLVMNLSAIAGGISALTSRSTWGNAYFHLINTLAISHPFWDAMAPMNFIYHVPLGIYWFNVLATGIILFFSFALVRRDRYRLLFALTLLFFLFMSKEDHPPFTYAFEYLYRLPYFSFSREASKYFYGYILSLSMLALIVLRRAWLIAKENALWRDLLIGLVLLCLAPSIFNGLVFASGREGDSTRPYRFDTQVYGELNAAIAADAPSRGIAADEEVRVLWLPLLDRLEPDTPRIRHMGFPDVLSLYPFSDVRTSSRTFLYESLPDPNVRAFLSLYGFRYVVIPDMANEPELSSELAVLYGSYDEGAFESYVRASLPLTPVATVHGYQLYALDAPPVAPRIVTDAFNPRYGVAGDIVLASSTGTFAAHAVVPDVRPGNCNDNPALGLTFSPSERIALATAGQDVRVSMWARQNEVPCVFFTMPAAPEAAAPYAALSSYVGKDTELVLYPPGKLAGAAAEKIYRLDANSVGTLPLACAAGCTAVLYLYGDTPAGTDETALALHFFYSDSPTAVVTDDRVLAVRRPVNSLAAEPVASADALAAADYIFLPLPYDPGYRLSAGNASVAPIPNNHASLLFDTRPLRGAGPATLSYLPELKVERDLRIADAANALTFLLAALALAVRRSPLPAQEGRRAPLPQHASALSQSARLRPRIALAFLALAGILFWLFAPAPYAFLGTIFLIWAGFRLDVRIVGASSLLLLALIPFLLAFGMVARAEDVAVYAFAFLILAVALQMLDVWRRPRAPRQPVIEDIRPP